MRASKSIKSIAHASSYILITIGLIQIHRVDGIPFALHSGNLRRIDIANPTFGLFGQRNSNTDRWIPLRDYDADSSRHTQRKDDMRASETQLSSPMQVELTTKYANSSNEMTVSSIQGFNNKEDLSDPYSIGMHASHIRPRHELRPQHSLEAIENNFDPDDEDGIEAEADSRNDGALATGLKGYYRSQPRLAISGNEFNSNNDNPPRQRNSYEPGPDQLNRNDDGENDDRPSAGNGDSEQPEAGPGQNGPDSEAQARAEQEAAEAGEAEAANKSALDEQQRQQREIIQAQAQSEARAIKEQQDALMRQQALQHQIFLERRQSDMNVKDKEERKLSDRMRKHGGKWRDEPEIDSHISPDVNSMHENTHGGSQATSVSNHKRRSQASRYPAQHQIASSMERGHRSKDCSRSQNHHQVHAQSDRMYS